MYNNADLISETYEYIATGKRQIRWFQWSHSCLTTLLWETPSKFEYTKLIYIARN